MAEDTSGLLCAHCSPRPRFCVCCMRVSVCQFSLCWVLVSLKSLLNSLAPYDIKQTHKSPSLHLHAFSLIHEHLVFPPLLSQSWAFCSLSQLPHPHSRLSLSDVVSFQERLPSLLPYKNTVAITTSLE